MPDYEDDDEFFDYGSLPEDEQQEFLFGQIGFDYAENEMVDPELHDMFWDLMYNDELTEEDRLAVYAELSEYVWEEYGLVFAELWDWEDFRSWYDAA